MIAHDAKPGKCEAISPRNRSCLPGGPQFPPSRTRGDIQGGAARPLLFDKHPAKRVDFAESVVPAIGAGFACPNGGGMREPTTPAGRKILKSDEERSSSQALAAMSGRLCSAPGPVECAKEGEPGHVRTFAHAREPKRHLAAGSGGPRGAAPEGGEG